MAHVWSCFGLLEIELMPGRQPTCRQPKHFESIVETTVLHANACANVDLCLS